MHHSRFNGPCVVFRSGSGMMFLVLFLIVSILLSGCNSPSTPSITPTPPPDESNLLPVNLKKDALDNQQPSSSNEPKPVLVLLVDRSDSMFNCETQRLRDKQMPFTQVNAGIVYFLWSLLKDKAEVKIAELPNQNEDIDTHALSSFESLAGMIEPQSSNSRNHFQKAFQSIHQQFSNSGQAYTVLLISDGAFNVPQHTGNRSDVDTWLQKNEQFTKNLHMLLLDCPHVRYNQNEYQDDKNMWKSRLEDRLLTAGNDTNIITGISQFIQGMVEKTNLKSALPTNNQNRDWAGWSDGILPNIPGYTRQITVTLFVLSPDLWKVNVVNNKIELLPNRENIELSLNIGSEEHKLTRVKELSGSPKLIPVPAPVTGSQCADLSLGWSAEVNTLLLYYTLSPEFVHDWLELGEKLWFSTSGDVIFDHDNPVFWNKPWNNGDFAIKIRGFYAVEGGISTIRNYHECYKMQLTASFDTGDKSVSIEGRGDKDEFSGFWSNELTEIPKDKVKELFSGISIDRPGKVTFIFELFTYNNEKAISKWQSDDIEVRFYPVIMFRSVEEKEVENSKIKVFEYVIHEFADCEYYGNCDSGGNVLKAYIYIPDGTDIETIQKCTRYKPEKIAIFNSYDISVLELQDKSSGRDIVISMLDTKTIRLEVKNYQKYLEDCNYQYLVLKWDQHMPSYICDLKNNNCVRADKMLKTLLPSSQNGTGATRCGDMAVVRLDPGSPIPGYKREASTWLPVYIIW